MSDVEVWRPVLGYEGTYEVSSSGRVRSLPRVVVSRQGYKQSRKGVDLTPSVTAKGYEVVNLSKDGLAIKRFVHVLVALAFRGEPNQCVRHLNGKPWDNRAANLAWGTHAENARDQEIHGTRFRTRELRCGEKHEFEPNEKAVGRGRHSCLGCEREMRQEWSAKVAGSSASCSECTAEFVRNSEGLTRCPDCNRRRRREQAKWRRINRSVAA